MKRSRLLLTLAAALMALGAAAADYPAPQEGDWVVRDFRFHTGETLPELRLHYTTVGARSGEPVLVLHGTTGSGAGFLTPAFAGELFGADSRSMRPAISSSFPTRSAPGNPPSPRTGCAPASRSTTTTTWSPPNIAWCASTSG